MTKKLDPLDDFILRRARKLETQSEFLSLPMTFTASKWIDLAICKVRDPGTATALEIISMRLWAKRWLNKENR